MDDLPLSAWDGRPTAAPAKSKSEQHDLVEAAFIFGNGHAVDGFADFAGGRFELVPDIAFALSKRGCCELITTTFTPDAQASAPFPGASCAGEQGRMYLISPGGYSARTKPTRILDDHGHAIVIAGDYSNLGGGLVPDESMSKPILGCPMPHEAWLVAPD